MIDKIARPQAAVRRARTEMDHRPLRRDPEPAGRGPFAGGMSKSRGVEIARVECDKVVLTASE